MLFCLILLCLMCFGILTFVKSVNNNICQLNENLKHWFNRLNLIIKENKDERKGS